MVFIELVTDAFSETFNKRASSGQRTRRAGVTRARRPMRGLEIKDDTYAVIRVVSSTGEELPIFDSSTEADSTNGGGQTTNFLLQSVVESRMEKHQIVETFGEPYIYFFGEHPRFLDCTAILINSNDFNWEAEFWANYDRYLRGTRLVEMGARTYMFYDDTIVEGYMLQAQAVKTSDSPLSVQLTFRLYLTNYQNISFVGSTDFPVRSSVNLPPGVDLTAADAYTASTAGVSSAIAAATEEVLAQKTSAGIRQQQAGFGGADKLTDSLRSGLVAGSDITGIAFNAFEALKNLVGGDGRVARTAPLRSKIADNLDEYTGMPRIPTFPEDKDGEVTVENSLPKKVVKEGRKHGAKVDEPSLLKKLGLLPNFQRTPNGFIATLGSYGAMPGMFGTTGGGLGNGFGSSLSLNLKANASITGALTGAIKPSSLFTTGYTAGVQTSGGLLGGVGFAGGVPKGAPTNGAGLMTGAAAGFSTGTVPAGPGGASTAVGGKPSCFSFVSVPGQFNQGGTITERVQWDPTNGLSTQENRTGIFAS